ncbi:MAG: hypothetical protein U0694_15730 [Anaerolineae bacterium]
MRASGVNGTVRTSCADSSIAGDDVALAFVIGACVLFSGDMRNHMGNPLRAPRTAGRNLRAAACRIRQQHNPCWADALRKLSSWHTWKMLQRRCEIHLCGTVNPDQPKIQPRVSPSSSANIAGIVLIFANEGHRAARRQ